MNMKLFATLLVLFTIVPNGSSVLAQGGGKNPNIVVMLGDNFGMDNLSTCHRGLAGTGRPFVEPILGGHGVGNRTFYVRLVGFDQSQFVAVKQPSARKNLCYLSEESDRLSFRHDRWEIHLKVQNARGLEMLRTEFESLRIPSRFELAIHPLERAADGTCNDDWLPRPALFIVPSLDIVRELTGSFLKYPPRRWAAAFWGDDVLEKLSAGNERRPVF